MKQQNVLALIIAYYLSKFDKEAYANLGYNSMNQAHMDIGRRFNVNPNSVRNMRDEFDSIHDNPRAGFYQRELRPSRLKVVSLFQDLSERGLREIVVSIFKNRSLVDTETFEIITSQIDNSERSREAFCLRGQTGRKAEELFINYHKSYGLPQAGDLIDTRDLGCGYDFEISTLEDKFFIEIKGLDTYSSGILFTDKEWFMANKHGEKYYLIVVGSVSGEAKFSIIKNPAIILNPARNIFTTVQISWSVPSKELNSLIMS